jgi:hypothetical protein
VTKKQLVSYRDDERKRGATLGPGGLATLESDRVESGGAGVNTLDYIGFDIHKKTIQLCVKRSDGELVEEQTLAANRNTVEQWAKNRRPALGGGNRGNSVYGLGL